MLTHILILMVLALALLGFWLGKRKVILAATSLHSLPVHYASYVLLMTILPASLTLAIWSLAAPWLLHDQSLTISNTNNTLAQTDTALKSTVVIIVAVLSLFFAMQKVSPEFRARNVVEKFILAALMICAALAILTTVGIVVSMVFETAHFLNLHSWKDFFFGLDWSPNFHGDSALSILPLLWGTLYISCVALLVAVPVGLLSAIYLSEYASSRHPFHCKAFTRSFGRDTHDRIWPFRFAHLWAILEGSVRAGGLFCRWLDERYTLGGDGGYRHGNYAHSLCLISVR